MPELPEVETVVRTLEKQIKGLKIVDVIVLYDAIIEGDKETFKRKLINQHFNDFLRRGKFLIFGLDNISLISHLRMEGKYYILEENDPIDKHTHIIFKLDNGKELRYHDVRKFGRMELMEKKDDYTNFKKLGPEPFSDSFNLNYVKEYLKDKKKPIKQIILDQNFLAGVGNIYVDEILWAIGVHPLRSGDSLTQEEMKGLIVSTRSILNNAIQAGGTTIRSYTSSLGVSGRFQMSLNCHTKDLCPRCSSDINKIKVGGRGTYYCPNCQKL